MLAVPRAIELARVATRREHDLLGEREVPAEAYWGIPTLRAVENFPITGIPIGHFPELIRALALVKQAAPRVARARVCYPRKTFPNPVHPILQEPSKLPVRIRIASTRKIIPYAIPLRNRPPDCELGPSRPLRSA